MDKLQEALHFRTAVKEFDLNQEISQEDLNYILEAGRLAPSSFGLEHWKFIVVNSAVDKHNIEKICYNQKQISTSSHIVILVSKLSDFHEDSQYIQDLLNQRMPEQTAQKVEKIIANFTNSMSDIQLKYWTQKQCYIAASHMMIAAAFKKIDSCPMEGFNEKALLDYLNLNSEEYTAALVLPFGFRTEQQREKTRQELKKIVEFRD